MILDHMMVMQFAEELLQARRKQVAEPVHRDLLFPKVGQDLVQIAAKLTEAIVPGEPEFGQWAEVAVPRPIFARMLFQKEQPFLRKSGPFIQIGCFGHGPQGPVDEGVVT